MFQVYFQVIDVDVDVCILFGGLVVCVVYQCYIGIGGWIGKWQIGYLVVVQYDGLVYCYLQLLLVECDGLGQIMDWYFDVQDWIYVCRIIGY